MAKKFVVSIPLVGRAGQPLSEEDVAHMLEALAQGLREISSEQEVSWETDKGVFPEVENAKWSLQSPVGGFF